MEERSANNNWRTFVFLSIYLIVINLWRLVVPAHEYGSHTLAWMNFLLEVAIVVALVGLRSTLVKALEPESGRLTALGPLFLGGLLFGIVGLLIRISSHQGWYTGHLRFELLPR
jgi:hypothetical protein